MSLTPQNKLNEKEKKKTHRNMFKCVQDNTTAAADDSYEIYLCCFCTANSNIHLQHTYAMRAMIAE